MANVVQSASCMSIVLTLTVLGWIVPSVNAEQAGSEARVRSARHSQVFDTRGKLIKETTQHDVLHRGKFEPFQTITYEYDNLGRLSVKTTLDGDGAGQHFGARSVFGYDGDSTAIQVEETENDNESDGKIDARTRISFTYKEGLLVKKAVERDNDANGSYDEFDKTMFSYADDGKMTSEVTENRSSSSAKVVSRTTNRFDYEGDVIATKTTEVDSNADGKADELTTTRFTRDNNGAIKREDVEIDEGADKIVDRQEHVAHTLSMTIQPNSNRYLLIAVNVVIVIAIVIFAIRRRADNPDPKAQ